MRYLAYITLFSFLFVAVFAGQAMSRENSQQERSTQMERSSPKEESHQKFQPREQLGAASEQGQPDQRQFTSKDLTSNQVSKIQEALKDQGFDPGPVDGIMGPRTREAIRLFQQDQAIVTTGEIDRETLYSLDVELEGQEFFGVSPKFEEQKGQPQQKQQPMQQERLNQQQDRLQQDRSQKQAPERR